MLAACRPSKQAAPSGAASGNAVSASPAANAKLDQWYQAAKKEGEVVWGTSTPDSYKNIGPLFERQYPGVKVTVVQADGATIADRMTLEAQTKRVSIDVNQSGINQSSVLIGRNLLTSYDFGGTSVDPSVSLLDGRLIWIADAIVGWTYNNRLLAEKDLPRTWNDLLDPKWKGKIAILSSGAEFDMLLASMSETELVDYLKRLAPQMVPVATTGDAVTKVSTGEALITNAATTLEIASRISKGAPLAALPMPAQESPNGFFTVKGTAHPNAAALFIAWAVSPEQKQAWSDAGLGRYQDCGPLGTDQLLCHKSVEIYYVNTQDKVAQTLKLRPLMVNALGLGK
jgi:iron(III) transport system substrate-binding protein